MSGYSPGSDVGVLVVEDEEIPAEAHAEYVRRVPGFRLAGIARTGAEALEALKAAESAPSGSEAEIGLVLLDMNLPDLHGLDLLRRIRGAGLPVDVIAITAVRDLAVVRSAMSGGIVQYLIKPFTFSAFSTKLTAYAEYRRRVAQQAASTTQNEVDNAFAALRPAVPAPLPKGLSGETLAAVADLLKRARAPLSAAEAAEALAMSRITTRRYLEYLADQQSVLRSPRYGTRGRPELEYSWRR
ncbi:MULTISPECIES: response regulator [unclassified Arthrobacter]|uniref:response regulator n=1 Tax=unclassified Arthrobacter TaxID=235627 RepID=UPI001E64BDE8|nr:MULTISPECIES: response regulator [unclassified Arthrobacter]MCC9144989.1 response regulator [Arthrobacter sp. zg-Y919]MDK1276217.1 response regulator [Arthrobacter sp. zg.Y919]WIB02171.1 response regulator [Arthrobacter sp. zg-Y919]